MFVEYLGYFYLIYQRLTTTSIRLHQRSNFKQPTYNIVRYWKEQIFLKGGDYFWIV